MTIRHTGRGGTPIKLVLSRTIIYAAGTDAGNRSMRKAGRSVWALEDYQAAVREMSRLNTEQESKP